MTIALPYQEKRMAQPKVIVNLYPVLPARDETERAARRPLGRDKTEVAGFRDPRHDRRRVRQLDQLHRESESEARQVAHPLGLDRGVDGDVERRLHAREGGDDLAPDMLDRGERQGAFVAGDEAALAPWTACWDDLVRFEIVPVRTSADAAAAIAPEL